MSCTCERSLDNSNPCYNTYALKMKHTVRSKYSLKTIGYSEVRKMHPLIIPTTKGEGVMLLVLLRFLESNLLHPCNKKKRPRSERVGSLSHRECMNECMD